MPGGRERLRVVGGGEAVQLRNAPSGRLYGLWCAVPAPDGGTEALGLSAGTSAATALATRAAHRIFDALSDQDDENLLDDIDPRHYAVIVKAMLVHRAKWGTLAEQLEKTWQPQGHGKHIARRDRIARLFGYGRPEIEEALACASNRATMIGCGEIREGELQKAHLYQIPLPPSLEGVEEPRALTVSLAWFSPINTRHQAYRRAKLEIAPENLLRRFGANRIPGQPADKSVLRGSLLHTRFEGQEAVDFVDGRFLALRVYCREQGGALDQSIPYGLAVTIEAGQGIPVYDEIRQALGIRPRS